MSKHNRDLKIGASIRAEDDGTVTFPLSSEIPVRTYDGDEILVHDAESVDLEWLNGGTAPLLDNHNRHDGISRQIGVILRAWIQDRRLYVTVRFSNRPEAQAVRQDVLDGVVRNVSVGYDIMRISRDQDADEYRVTRWRPTEASFVPVPADMTVGVGRSAKPMEPKMSDDKPKMPDVKTDEQRAAELETSLNEVRALAATHSVRDIGESFIAAEIRRGVQPSIEVFRGIVRSELPDEVPLRNEDVGLTDGERRKFSFIRLANAMRDGASAKDQEAAAFEIEACGAAAANSEQKQRGMFVIPTDLMDTWGDFEVNGVRSTRAPVSAGTTPNVQDTAHLAQRFIDNLRNQLVLGQLGVTMLPGLEGNVEIPGGDQNSQAAWLGTEDADAAETVPTFRKIELSVKDVAAYTDITRRMLQQSTIAIELYVRNQLVRAMAEAIDLAGWYGSGVGGVPEGLANTTGIGSVTFAAAIPTRDELIDMDTAIANTNKVGSPTFVSTTAMSGALRKKTVDAGSGRFLMNNADELEIGNAFVRSNQIESGDIFAGTFEDMMMGMWGSLELDRSTEAKFLSGGLRLRAIQSVDFAVSRVGSFVLGNDGV